MMKAWKRDDGWYDLLDDGLMGAAAIGALATFGVATCDRDTSRWAASARTVAMAGIEKVYGVVTGPSSCGCEPAMFRWVGAEEVDAGRTRDKYCVECNLAANPHNFMPILSRCDIIDVCGEADVARAVYEAEFRALVEG